MKLALYSLCGSTYHQPLEAFSWREGDKDYLRLSEFVEVEFTLLAPEVVVPLQLERLGAMEAELRNKFNEKLSEINTERANLLALTHQVQP